MQFSSPLVQGHLIKRYKRFLADVLLNDGTVVTAHCPNSGAMLGLKAEGTTVYLSRSDNPNRKLPYTWEMAFVDGGLVGVNTQHPNSLVHEAFLAQAIPELSGYSHSQREVKYGVNSRIDLLLSGEGQQLCYVEVKNAHLMETAGMAQFPDAVTARGAKHMQELKDMVAQGHRAVIFYVIQRMDCDSFSLASHIDPTYAKATYDALDAGVEVLCYACKLSLEGIFLDRRIDFERIPL
ncbi:MAG: DNA/RNA nuclease SfsA [Holosporales bacterium]